MKTVEYIEIVIRQYHDDIIGQIRFYNPVFERIEESNNYSLVEINNIIQLMKDPTGGCMGSFGIGCVFSDKLNFQIIQG